MVLGGFGRTPSWNCDFAQPRCGIPAFAVRLCAPLARDCFNRDCGHPGALERSILIPKRADLGFVRPNRATAAIE